MTVNSSRAFEDFIWQAGGCLVIDGGLSTQLENYGADIKDSLWSALCLITMPDLIFKVHLDYLRAGAEVIITASYQATLQRFESKGLSADVGESLLRKSDAVPVMSIGTSYRSLHRLELIIQDSRGVP